MADLRILQLIKGLDIGGVNGGAERFSIDLSKQLKNFGYKVDLCAFYKMNTPAEADWLMRLQEKDQEVFFATAWAGPNNLGNFIAGCKALREYAEREKPVVLHSHFQQGTYAAIWLKKKLKIPVVVRTTHNVLEWEPGFLGRVKEVISDFVYPRQLDAEVGVSKAIVEQLSIRYPTHSKKVRPILAYNGILLPSVDNTSSVTRNAENGFTIGTVGRLAEQKGYTYLLAAIPSILEHHPQTRLIFLGDGELRSQLEAQTRQLGLQTHVEFAGQVDDVLARLPLFDLFVSSSLWEGLPTVIMEAMAVGLPVIATDIPGTREMISDTINGRLVPPGDPVALADAITGMIENPQMRQDFGKAGKKSVKKFSIEEIAKTYLELYESLLAGPGKND
ncbi:MAG: glycosyltransferase family 4 protein [Anaerolineaceae bacterium]|jgi:glycosyltransferase involved in cell wall biosynthesis|nr:glycosyltransferase family 4 protein [Anaerolineaceae bacterium]MDD4043253.1 glycosyltransferase family 4 protein [Anaerolineaceae bacterium]MDD4577463.1 glycosyltransferase family 4 protein [Anaerolineaceae bacterium]